jgi:UDP-N-acetylmuramyl pentapeptide phosphotransferase/UDP-N-acetylglucosamine-1-phosphate transferase
MWSYYLGVFAGTVVLSLALTRFIRDDANRRGWLDAPSTGRHRHSIPVPRLGALGRIFARAGVREKSADSIAVRTAGAGS